jgi:hypothetical protein
LFIYFLEIKRKKEIGRGALFFWEYLYSWRHILAQKCGDSWTTQTTEATNKTGVQKIKPYPLQQKKPIKQAPHLGLKMWRILDNKNHSGLQPKRACKITSQQTHLKKPTMASIQKSPYGLKLKQDEPTTRNNKKKKPMSDSQKKKGFIFSYKERKKTC